MTVDLNHTDGIFIQNAAYDPTTQKLTLDVIVNTSAADYVTAPKNIWLFQSTDTNR